MKKMFFVMTFATIAMSVTASKVGVHYPYPKVNAWPYPQVNAWPYPQEFPLSVFPTTQEGLRLAAWPDC